MSTHHFGFGAPGFLVALLAVPVLYGFALALRRRRSRYAVLFTNAAVLRAVVGRRRSRWPLRLPLVLMALALATAALGLARPHVRIVASNRGTTVMLVADVSGSMAATDVYPERIYAAAGAMRDLVEALPADDKVGLMTFSDDVELLDAPTTDHAAVTSSLATLSPEGGTALGAGVEAAIRLLVSTLAAAGVHHSADSFLPAAIVLESDGAQDRGKVTPFAAARLARATGIRIYAVALGTRYGFITQGSGLLKESFHVPPDPGVAALLARESGGQSYSATSAGSLDTIYRGLGATLGRRPEQSEITSWFELAAALLLVAAVAAARLRGAALP